MSIIISGVLFHYPNQNPLFSDLNLSVESGDHISIVGDNGCGKSTLLELIAGRLEPQGGDISLHSHPYYIPQNIAPSNQTIASVMQVEDKLMALHAISAGSVAPQHYDTLGDDWDIVAKVDAALARWSLSHLDPTAPLSSLSGGERTKVMLAAIEIHQPEIVLMDEPTNHLDELSRQQLYRYIDDSNATIVVVSHDVTLLNRLETTYELTRTGIKSYGGNYLFYSEQKRMEERALEASIQNEESSVRRAKQQAQIVKQRQERRSNRAARDTSGLPHIIAGTRRNRAQLTDAVLNKKHENTLLDRHSKLSELRDKQRLLRQVKIDIESSPLHRGKRLIKASQINHAYDSNRFVWESALSLELFSGDRLHIRGDNGSGKSTLINALIGRLEPSIGEVLRAEFSHAYLDQEYSLVGVEASVLELAEQYNLENLADHEVKMQLSRALFPVDSWDRSCATLSGGERMRLYLTLLMLSGSAPDLLVLDEPSNNIDLSTLQVLIQTIREYRGTLIVVSHDQYFIAQINLDREIILPRFYL